MPDFETLLSTPEAAEVVDLAPSTLSKLRVFGGGPPYIKIGRRVMYRRRDLQAWIDQHIRSSTSETPPSAKCSRGGAPTDVPQHEGELPTDKDRSAVAEYTP